MKVQIRIPFGLARFRIWLNSYLDYDKYIHNIKYKPKLSLLVLVAV